VVTPRVFTPKIMATSSILHQTAPGRTASPAQLLWPTGFLCGWSIGLEFPAGQLAESDYWREQFQTISEKFLFATFCMHSAHYRFHDDTLYKSTFYLLLLTYSAVSPKAQFLVLYSLSCIPNTVISSMSINHHLLHTTHNSSFPSIRTFANQPPVFTISFHLREIPL